MKKNILFRKKTYFMSSLLFSGAIYAQATPPNIVLFLVDDMGWQDTSEPFWNERTPYNDICQTPNMERLARQGVKFTNAYACAISSPTRTSLMTGMNAARHRVTNWTLRKNTSTDAQDNTLSFPSWNYNGLQPNGSPTIKNALYATTLPEILRKNGYYTVHCGKGHFGAMTTKGAELTNLGFDVNIAGGATGGPGSYYGTQNYGNSIFQVPGLTEYKGTDTYLTEALTLEALKTLNSRPKDKPFYLYMSHYTVHVPIQPDTRFLEKYKAQGFTGDEAAYLTMVEGMDKSLGDILDWLDANGEAENTIVIFMSDNGGHHSVGNISKNGKNYAHNYPLRSSKGSAYEGGIREPLIVYWNGVTHANTTNDHRVIIEDFFPTIIEMAEISDYHTTQTVDGVSFVPTLKGETQKENNHFWHYPNKWGEYSDGCESYSAVRSGDYKLIYRWGTQKMELYNIKNDIGEETNLVWLEKDRVAELAKILSDYLRSVSAQRPTTKATGKLVPYPDEIEIEFNPIVPEASSNTETYWYYLKNMGYTDQAGAMNFRWRKALAVNVNGEAFGTDAWDGTPTKLKIEKKKGTDNRVAILTEDNKYLNPHSNDNYHTFANSPEFTNTPYNDWILIPTNSVAAKNYFDNTVEGFQIKPATTTLTTPDLFFHLKAKGANYNTRHYRTEAANVWSFIPLQPKVLMEISEGKEHWYYIRNAAMDKRKESYLNADKSGTLFGSEVKGEWKIVLSPLTKGKMLLVNKNEMYASHTSENGRLVAKKNIDTSCEWEIKLGMSDFDMGYRFTNSINTADKKILHLTTSNTIRNITTYSTASVWFLENAEFVSGVENHSEDKNRIFVKNGTIIVTGTDKFHIFDTQGQQYATDAILSSGVYIVKTDKTTSKVIIHK